MCVAIEIRRSVVSYLRVAGIVIGRLAVVVAAVCCHAAAADATGTITGQIIDSRTGHSIVGAIVRVVDHEGEAVSDARGEFVLRNVPSGSRRLLVTYIGLGDGEQTVDVKPGETARQDITLAADSRTIDTIVIRGQALGQERALNLQRSADSLKNVIAADAIGNFPDQNVAEALGRVSGISIERDQGEGRYVTIRGIDSELNGYLSDGLSFAAPRSDDRAVLLDMVPSDVLDRLEVSKTILPDQPGDAIGGAINIKSPSAFTRGTMTGRGNAQWNYSNLRDASEAHVDGTAGTLFGGERFGVMVAFSLDERTLGVDNQQAPPWELQEDPVSGTEFYFPGELDVRQYDDERKRTGTTVNFEFKPSDTAFYYLRGIYNEFTDHQNRHRTIIELDADGLESLTNTSAVVNVGDDESIGETELVQEGLVRTEELSLWGISTGGENRLGPLTIDYQVGYSFADEEEPDRFRATYVLSDITQIEYTQGQSLTPVIAFTGVGIDPRVAANFEFDGTTDIPRRVEEDHWEYSVNTRYDFGSEDEYFAKTGLRVRLKDKRQGVEHFVSDANPATVDTLDQITMGRGRNAFNTDFPLVDPRIHDIYRHQQEEFAVERDFTLSTVNDWRSTEDVVGTYVMGGHTIGKLSLIGGLRFERTEFETGGFEVDEAAETATATHVSHTYSDWLPGLHARYSPSDNLVIRASYTNAIARPGFQQSAAASLIDGDEIERGNPGLSQAQSTNLDVSAEYYLPESLGIISVGAFHKQIDDFLFPRVFDEIIDGQTFEVTTFDNGESGDVDGVEFAYQQQLTFLPAPLDRFGFYGNVLFVESEAKLPVGVGRSDSADLEVPFPRQSDRVANVALTYEHGGLFVRVSATFRSDYLDRVAEEPSGDIYFQDHLQWDVSSRYTFMDRWTVFANFINVDDEPLGARYGHSDRLRQFEAYSWSTQVGIDFAL